MEARLTILGHVQRGGAPSAFDRWMSALLGHVAVDALLRAPLDREPPLIGVHANRVTRPADGLRRADAGRRRLVAGRDFDRAMAMRGGSFTEMATTFAALAQALPSASTPRRRGPPGRAARRWPGAGDEHRRPRGGAAGVRPGT